jgi:hypothetical protein
MQRGRKLRRHGLQWPNLQWHSLNLLSLKRPSPKQLRLKRLSLALRLPRPLPLLSLSPPLLLQPDKQPRKPGVLRPPRPRLLPRRPIQRQRPTLPQAKLLPLSLNLLRMRPQQRRPNPPQPKVRQPNRSQPRQPRQKANLWPRCQVRQNRPSPQRSNPTQRRPIRFLLRHPKPPVPKPLRQHQNNPPKPPAPPPPPTRNPKRCRPCPGGTAVQKPPKPALRRTAPNRPPPPNLTPARRHQPAIPLPARRKTAASQTTQWPAFRPVHNLLRLHRPPHRKPRQARGARPFP